MDIDQLRETVTTALERRDRKRRGHLFRRDTYAQADEEFLKHVVIGAEQHADTENRRLRAAIEDLRAWKDDAEKRAARSLAVSEELREQAARAAETKVAEVKRDDLPAQVRAQVEEARQQQDAPRPAPRRPRTRKPASKPESADG